MSLARVARALSACRGRGGSLGDRLDARAAAAAAVACCVPHRAAATSAPVLCEAKNTSSPTGSSSSPFVYPELQAGIQRRIQAQQKLIQYMHSARQKLENMEQRFMTMGGPGSAKAQEWFAKEMQKFQQQVNNDTQVILYGVRDPGARDRYMARFGCAAWTDEALEVVVGFSPIIEIGAGKGQWQKALTGAGADVLAFDNNEAVPTPEVPAVGDVRPGDHTQILRSKEKTLFLCYPEGELAEKCIELYRGDHLIYVGEGRGGVNADRRFFDRMEREWVCEQIVHLQPFNECFERLYVMKRAHPLKKGWLGLF